MYESKNDGLLSRAAFLKRLFWHVFAAFCLVIVVMLLGVLGHMVFDDITLHDALLNTAFLLGGIGTLIVPSTVSGKVFIALYGFVTSLFFVASIGLILAPIIHRVIHKFHLDDE